MRRHPAAGARSSRHSARRQRSCRSSFTITGAGRRRLSTGRRGERSPSRRASSDRGLVRRYDLDPAVQAVTEARRGLREIQRCAGTQFDPELVGAFAEAWAAGWLGMLVWQEAQAS